MIYFIYKQGSGIAPQAGYSHLSMYKGTDTWWLVSTENTSETVLGLSLETLIIGTDTDAEVLAAFPDLVAQKADKLRATGSIKLTELNGLAGGYFKEERETWYVQKAETEAYLSWVADGSVGDAPSTPMLSGIVANRPDLTSVADIASLVDENTTLLEAASGVILGKQQAALVSVYTAADLITAMNVAFPE